MIYRICLQEKVHRVMKKNNKNKSIVPSLESLENTKKSVRLTRGGFLIVKTCHIRENIADKPTIPCSGFAIQEEKDKLGI